MALAAWRWRNDLSMVDHWHACIPLAGFTLGMVAGILATLQKNRYATVRQLYEPSRKHGSNRRTRKDAEGKDGATGAEVNATGQRS